MTRTPRRPAVLAVTAGLALLLLSGCGDSRLQAGAAALVGDTRIATAELQERVDQALADPQAAEQVGDDRAGFQVAILDRLVKRALLKKAADDLDVSVTDGEVAQRLDVIVQSTGTREELEARAAQSGIAPQDLDAYIRDLVLADAVGDALTADAVVPESQLAAAYQQNIASYDRVRTRHILVPTEASARMILADVMKDPARFADLAAQFSTDTSNKDTGGDLGLAPRGQFVPEFEKVAFALPVGGFGVARTEFGFHVINVLEHPLTTLQEATPELRRGLLQEPIQQATTDLLTRTAEQVGVTVNPRFGVWDPQAVTVVASDDPNGVLVDPPAPDPNAPGDPNAPADPAPAPSSAS